MVKLLFFHPSTGFLRKEATNEASMSLSATVIPFLSSNAYKRGKDLQGDIIIQQSSAKRVGSPIRFPLSFSKALKKLFELNKEFSPTISAKVMNNSQVVHEDVSFNSVGGSGNNKGGSVLGVLDEMIRVGRAMGYSMEGCEKDIESIINSKGDEAVFR
ncbi:hypothetical protein Tco_0015587 [Tanacetum coccineum]